MAFSFGGTSWWLSSTEGVLPGLQLQGQFFRIVPAAQPFHGVPVQTTMVFDEEKIFSPTKVENSLKSIEWGTPHDVFSAIDNEFGFTLDVCASNANHKCRDYFTKEENGLRKSWGMNVCWCNPPYGKDVRKWCKKALEESYSGATTVLLIPCKTNTGWWHDLVIPHAEVRFIRGRIAFLFPDGTQSKQALPWPLAFVIYRPSQRKLANGQTFIHFCDG